MQRCIELARLGLGRTAPNPMVGALVLHNDRIIGEGYHRRCGDHHAEVRAIMSVANERLFSKSTLFVSLEPCCHHGKTPPCTDLIIEKRIPSIVIGTTDPYAEVAGKGIARLRGHGCHVKVGVMKDACRQLNKRFFTFHEKKRPYIVLKWAQTADGFIDTERGPGAIRVPTWITSEKLRILVHKWRSEEQAIMVGTRTALKDNPQLNVRDWHGPSPTRIVLDRELKLPANLHLLNNNQSTIVINEIIEKTSGKTRYMKLPFNDMLLHTLTAKLYEEGLQSLFVEGGRQLLQGFIDQDLWDEARVFTGTGFFGKGVEAPDIPAQKPVSQIMIGQEVFYCFRNT